MMRWLRLCERIRSFESGFRRSCWRVEGDEGELKEADAAEERLVEETRLLGREALQVWAENRVEATGPGHSSTPSDASPRLKKLRWHTKFGAIEVQGAAISVREAARASFRARCEGEPAGVFAAAAERVIVDFAADQPFAQARAKLQEHYGFAIGESTIQRITFAHAEAMYEAGREELEFPEAPGLRKPIVVETDGGMVPISGAELRGERQAQGQDVVLAGGEAVAGARAREPDAGLCGRDRGRSARGRAPAAFCCAVRAGFGANSRVHAVGDGAPWIVGQVEEQFGDQGRYLIDFYHVCEYLAAASEAIAPDPAARSVWMETQKDALKSGRLDAVLRALAGYCEPRSKVMQSGGTAQ